MAKTYLKRVLEHSDKIGYQYKSDTWKKISFGQFHAECKSIANGLAEIGVQAGDKVCILSQTRLEWSLCDFAIMGCRAVTVPIYASSTIDDVAYLLSHSEASVVFVEDLVQLEKVLAVFSQKKKPGPLKKIITFDPYSMSAAHGLSQVMTLQSLQEIGKKRLKLQKLDQPDWFESQLALVEPEDLLTICYTSGTTGVPKGVMLTHDNMMSVMQDAVAVLGTHIESEKERLLTFLPFSHIIGKCESMAGYVFGWQSCFAENFDRISVNLNEIQPTLLFAVPRIFEKAMARINAAVKDQPLFLQKLIKKSMACSNRYFDQTGLGRKPEAKDIMGHFLAEKTIYKILRQKISGQLKFAISGGAPLSAEVGQFFRNIGIKILEGYGLTETSAPITLMTMDRLVFGTVGKPLPEVALKISKEGEILVKSRKVFKGYYKMPEETAQVLIEGWLYTGDVGEMNQEGYLRITDRIKDIIVTSGGKNIAPQKIEGLAKTLPYINQMVVHGDKRNYLVALLTLDQDLIIKYADQNQILFSQFEELIKHPKIIDIVGRQIEKLNQNFASYETIKRFKILPKDFTIEAGEVTPSLKIKRRVIEAHYKTEIDRLYKN